MGKRKTRVIEFQATDNQGTKYRIYFSSKIEGYVIETRNDKIGVSMYSGKKFTGVWVNLDAHTNYSDALDEVFVAIMDVDAKGGL